IGKFEGVEEAMARIGGLTYLMDSARTLTLTALDQGKKPSVLTAIVKYYLTEGMRQAVNDAMDVHGGRGICLGPSNYLGRSYQTIPVGITVEGANILTRTLIIFGQGAMRCHPFVMAEMEALNSEDEDEGIRVFDGLLMNHLAYVSANAARSFVYAMTLGRFASSPVTGEVAKYYRQLTRFSASFATMADISLLVLGGALKRKEKLSGRFADALGYMYLCSATLKRFEDDGRPESDLPMLHWSCQFALYHVQEALFGIVRNYPVKVIGWKLLALVFPLGRRLHLPSDRLGHQISTMLMEDSEARSRLIDGIYLPDDPDDITGRLGHAFELTLKADEVEKRLRSSGHIYEPSEDYDSWLRRMQEDSMISREEKALMAEAYKTVHSVIMVDDFPAGKKPPSRASEA
ncbi:MAG TPA: acyl-CoA dehydrogenase domain-containing protein, partial [Mariprofundaceae bacterium]|nr:acyl-CoA dehydrogenase domain-containing protein [Mariprofundaceae bacterium]